MKNRIINVQDVAISISQQELDDYICITDIAKAKSDSARAADVVRNWLRNRSTLEYLSVWEQIYNPQFKVFESEHFKKQVGLLTFTPSVSEWINKTNAIGLYVSVESMVVRMHIKTLLLNLHLRSVRFLNYIPAVEGKRK